MEDLSGGGVGGGGGTKP
ncbi:unnamed protein product, partial [Rotaria magnacalcarata]